MRIQPNTLDRLPLFIFGVLDYSRIRLPGSKNSLNLARELALTKLILPLLNPGEGTHRSVDFLEVLTGSIVLSTELHTSLVVNEAGEAVPGKQKKNAVTTPISMGICCFFETSTTSTINIEYRE